MKSSAIKKVAMQFANGIKPLPFREGQKVKSPKGVGKILRVGEFVSEDLATRAVTYRVRGEWWFGWHLDRV